MMKRTKETLIALQQLSTQASKIKTNPSQLIRLLVLTQTLSISKQINLKMVKDHRDLQEV